MSCFKQGVKGLYYFHYTDQHGVRHTKATGTTILEEAEDFEKKFLLDYAEDETPTLLNEMKRYLKPEQNPKYKQSLIDGSSYTFRYAQKVAHYMDDNISALKKYAPHYLSLKLSEITRRDAKCITEAIVNFKGRTRSAQIMQQQFKVLFAEAFQDGLIQVSPFQGQHEIRYEAKVRTSIEADWIAWVVNTPSLFLDTRSWAFFTVLATTGMRRGEVLALTTEQVKGNVLYIDRAMQGNHADAPTSKPKCGIIRTVPLSRITQKALSLCPKYVNGRYFFKSSEWVNTVFKNLKATLNGCDSKNKEMWKDMTPHVLRHSFNTNLLAEGTNPLKVAEYCGWSHQGLVLDMQSNYMHFKAKHLQEVADIVDKIYGEKELISLSL